MQIPNGKFGIVNMVNTQKGITVLVTGGAGFIGAHLVEELLERKYKVIVVDIDYKKNSYFAYKNLHKKAKVELIDITNKEKITWVITQYEPSYIFHLAAEPIVSEAYKDPYGTFKTNIMGTIHLLEAVRLSNSVKGIIIASSDKAYGKTKKAYTEESPLKGDHPYDVSKSCADLISQTYITTYNQPIVITRFGNVYGEGDIHFDRLIPGICQSIVTGQPLTIRSNGKYVRDYIYVKDVVHGYLFLLDNIAKTKGQAYNFSSSDTWSVLEVIEKTEKVINKKIPYDILNNAQNEIPYQHLNDRKVREIGWKTKHSFDSEIASIVQWYRTFLKGDINTESKSYQDISMKG